VTVLAACHVHSNLSYDGSYTLEALSDKFSRAGYRVLMMTEHDRGFSPERLRQLRQLCDAASTRDLLVIPGIEYSDASNQVHILVWGDVPFLGENLPTRETLHRVKEAGGVAVLAHPFRRNAWQCFEPSWGEALAGIEVWNRKYDGLAPNRIARELQRSVGAIPFVGLDFHTQKQFFPLAMAMGIDSTVTEQSVLRCIQARRVKPRVFGVEVDGQLVRHALPILEVAEASRKKCASTARKMKLRV
jgi:predicted metal-dependent phosphoesterase TrpH